MKGNEREPGIAAKTRAKEKKGIKKGAAMGKKKLRKHRELEVPTMAYEKGRWWLAFSGLWVICYKGVAGGAAIYWVLVAMTLALWQVF